MKYIVIQHEGFDCAVLFNEAIPHRVEAAGRKVLGAGFCNASGEVWGHSEGLKVESRPEDATHVRLALEMTLNPKP
jgi:hypothetical protein